MGEKWQLREPYFKGANTYEIGVKGLEMIKVDVDKDGAFEIIKTPKFALGVYAKRVRP